MPAWQTGNWLTATATPNSMLTMFTRPPSQNLGRSVTTSPTINQQAPILLYDMIHYIPTQAVALS